MATIFHFMPDAPKPVAPYSHAVEADGFVFVTGQLATDPQDDARPLPDGIEAQTRKVMDNLGRVLKGLGLDFANVICVRIFLTAFERDYAAMNAIYAAYFAADPHHGWRDAPGPRWHCRDRSDCQTPLNDRRRSVGTSAFPARECRAERCTDSAREVRRR